MAKYHYLSDEIAPKIFDGDSFKEWEFLAFISSCEVGEYFCLGSKRLKVLRSRILNLCRKYEVIGTTTKVNETTLRFTYCGKLIIKKPVRNPERKHAVA